MAKAKQQDVIISEDDNGLDFLDFQAPEQHLDAEIYPFLQWNNDAGKWEFPLEQWAGTTIDRDNETVEVKHNFGQDTEPAILLDTIHVSVIAQRYTWEHEDDMGRRQYSAAYEPGMRKRYNFLVLVKEAETVELALITARSYTGSYIEAAIKTHRQTVLKLASRMGRGTRYPKYLFWLPLTAGEKVYVGSEKKSQIQPPVPIYTDFSDLDDAGIVDLLKSLYIGDELRDAITDYLYAEGETWAGEFMTMAALPKPNNVEATILPGNILMLPDLSDRKPSDWIKCAMSIDGLFDHDNHASNAFAKLLRSKPGLVRQPASDQWEAWRTELERRYAEKAEMDAAVETEKMLQAG